MARVRRAVPVAEINSPVDQTLDREPVSEQRREQHARVRDRPLVIESTLVASGSPFTMRVTSWCRPAVAAYDSFLPAQEVN